MKSSQLVVLQILLCAGMLTMLGACDQSQPTKIAAAPKAALPVDLFVQQQPVGALGVSQVKTQAKAGEHVVMLGRIGGSKSPFVSNRAVFTMVDPSIKTCAEMPDDHCKTPADYCCEDSNDLAKALASVSIVNADGKPLNIALETEGSLKPLMLIAVEGTLQSTDNGAFVVNAQHIYKVVNDPLASTISKIK